MGRVLSAVDIGSNTIHLLVADADAEGVRKLSDMNEWLSLGEIVGRTGEISLTVQDQLVRTLSEFKKQAKTHAAEGWYVFGTEALRKATNSRTVLKRLRAELGVDVELVSGEREAELGVRGALIDSGGATSMLLAEVGGGSAQLAQIVNDKLKEDISLPIGTGTLMAKLDIACPCKDDKLKLLTDHIQKALAGPKSFKPERMVASGGVGRGLWRALHPDGDRWLQRKELDYLIWSTQRLKPEQIMARFRVKPKRAATLLPGAVVFRSVMEAYAMDEMLVSRFGVREGAILEMFAGRIKPCPL